MRRIGPRGPGVARPRAVAVVGVVLAGLALAACSAGGSSGIAPTRTASAGPPSATRTPNVSRTASAGAPGSTTGGATGTASGTSSGTGSASSTSAPAAGTTTTATATQTRTETATQTRTQTATATTTTTATGSSSAPAAAASPSPTAAASPAAGATSGAEAETSGEIPWWAWALLALVVAGLVAAMVLTQRRRRRAVEAWDQAQADAEDSALWLHDRVLPPVLADPSPATTAAAWSAARPRFLELDEQLTALGRNAPDEERRAGVVALRSALADTAIALDRRASAATRQAWAAAQAQAELAAERLAHVLAYDAPVGVQEGSTYGAGYPAPQGTAYVRPSDDGYGTGPEAAASVLAAPAPAAPAPRPAPPEDASAEARGPVPPLPRPAPPTASPPASTPPDLVDGSSGEEDAGGGGGRHVRPHD